MQRCWDQFPYRELISSCDKSKPISPIRSKGGKVWYGPLKAELKWWQYSMKLYFHILTLVKCILDPTSSQIATSRQTGLPMRLTLPWEGPTARMTFEGSWPGPQCPILEACDWVFLHAGQDQHFPYLLCSFLHSPGLFIYSCISLPTLQIL